MFSDRPKSGAKHFTFQPKQPLQPTVTAASISLYRIRSGSASSSPRNVLFPASAPATPLADLDEATKQERFLNHERARAYSC